MRGVYATCMWEQPRHGSSRHPNPVIAPPNNRGQQDLRRLPAQGEQLDAACPPAHAAEQTSAASRADREGQSFDGDLYNALQLIQVPPPLLLWHRIRRGAT